MIICHLIIKDRVSKVKWSTRNHNADKRKDDYHREIKQKIIRDLKPKLRELFGKNPNIEIADGEIIIISQRYDNHAGGRFKRESHTGLSADKYFDKFISLLITDILKITKYKLTVIIDVEIEDTNTIIIVLNIYLPDK